MQKILKRIQSMDDGELHAVMDAVRARYTAAYPEWDVIYTAVHKDPEMRKHELAFIIDMFQKMQEQ